MQKKNRLKSIGGTAVVEALIASSILAVTIVSVVKLTHSFNESQKNALIGQLAQAQVRDYVKNQGSTDYINCEQVKIVGSIFEPNETMASVDHNSNTNPGSNNNPYSTSSSQTSPTAGTSSSSSNHTNSAGTGSAPNSTNSPAPTDLAKTEFSLNCDSAFRAAVVNGESFTDTAVPKTAQVAISKIKAQWSIGIDNDQL